MPRVIGIDPGTVTIDLCGLDEGRVFLDRVLPTREALADPDALIRLLEELAPLDLIAGPSGYGLPLASARDLTDADLRLACLAAAGETGGIGGLRSFLRALARLPVPVVLTPGVVQLPTVPAHRKINRVDMGTADKVCAAALAIHEERTRRGCRERDVSCILLELGGAFTAALAIRDGAIVDGLGGSSGALGLRAAGALDGEVAYLAGEVSKALLFRGGAADAAGMPGASIQAIAAAGTPRARMALAAYVESAAKAVLSLAVSVPGDAAVVLSGRAAAEGAVHDRLVAILAEARPNAQVRRLAGIASTASQAAQGAALVADGLAGGESAALVDALRLRDAAGTVLDHLVVISPDEARRRIGIP